MLWTTAVATGAAMATSSLGSETPTFETSIATAGAATERNPRTATAEDAAGEPAKCKVKSACKRSAKCLLAFTKGRCASSQGSKFVVFTGVMGSEFAFALTTLVFGSVSEKT
jgi:hypothetical protein